MAEASKEYAVALFELAKEKNCEDDVLQSLSVLKSVFELVPELYSFLCSPGISKKERIEVIKTSFGNHLNEYAIYLLCVLCEHNNSGIVNEVIKTFEDIYNENHCVSKAVVTSAVELTDSEKESLCEKLKMKFNKEFESEYRVEPSLLGGVIVEADGIILDGSLKSRLQTMKEVIGK